MWSIREVLNVLARRMMPWTSYPFIPFREQEFGEVRSVLARDACDQRSFGHSFPQSNRLTPRRSSEKK